MGLDLWFREDVARILASTQETMRASQAATVVNEDYQQGFVDALRSVAVAFGVARPGQAIPGGPSRRFEVLEGGDLDGYSGQMTWSQGNGRGR